MVIVLLAAAAATLPKATPIDIASWFSADDYPVEAQKKGIEGTATFEVDVDASGKPTACRITQSSGSPALDQKTCEVVLAKARFKPAMRHGRAVAGRYSQLARWQLEGSSAIGNGYFANIIDFSKNPDHPTCSVVSSGLSVGLSCERALQAYGSWGAGDNLAKLTILVSFTAADAQPYRGDPTWGRRVAFIAYDLYSPKDAGTKKACSVVAKEGAVTTLNPCDPYSDAAALSEQQRKDAAKTHIENSLFAIVQQAPAASGRCKSGESAAESRGCV